MNKFKPKNELLNIIFAIGLIIGFIFFVSLSIFFIINNYGASCVSETPCSCETSIPIVIAVLTSLGVFVGILTYYFLSKSFFKEKERIYDNAEKTLNFLDSEGKKILSVLIKNDGEIVQKKLSKLTNIDSVKLHRRLSILEAKKIINKKKNGMTNKIILNEDFKKIFIPK